MSTAEAKKVILMCNKAIFKMQSIADLLLLQSDVRPVCCETTDRIGNYYVKCREAVFIRTKEILVTVGGIVDLLHSYSAKWTDIYVYVNDLCDLVTALTECSAHAVYCLTTAFARCAPARSGPILPYRVARVQVEISSVSNHLQQASLNQLDAPQLVKLCTEMNRNLSILTDSCRNCAEHNDLDSSDREQFRLAVRAFTTAASAFLQSVRVFKAAPTEIHLRRCVRLAEALTSSTSASVTLACEQPFVGRPARLTPEAKDLRKLINGACMSVVSSCVQLTRTVMELAYDNQNQAQRERVLLCRDAVLKSVGHLSDMLEKHEPPPTPHQQLPTTPLNIPASMTPHLHADVTATAPPLMSSNAEPI